MHCSSNKNNRLFESLNCLCCTDNILKFITHNNLDLNRHSIYDKYLKMQKDLYLAIETRFN